MTFSHFLPLCHAFFSVVQLLLDSLKQNGMGFGAASAEQVRQVWRFADAAVYRQRDRSRNRKARQFPKPGEARR